MEGYTVKYFISHEILGEKEVTKQEFIKAERSAGFSPKSGNPEDCATGGFGANGIKGTVRYIKNDD